MACRIALLVAAAVCASCGALGPSAEDLRTDPHGHLVRAARTGDVAAIRKLAASGVDLDASSATAIKFIFPDFDHAQATALQHAVRKGQVEAVRVLLEWGAQPDARQDGYTPLAIAAGSKDPTIARLLLDAGADVNVSLKVLAQAEPGGPLWHIIEHVFGSPSPKDVQERILAAAAQSRP